MASDSILFGLVGNLITKLGSLALKELGLFCGVGDELDKLKGTLSAIKAVLVDAEEQQSKGNNAVKDWISKLKDALYDIDDLFDELSYEALRRQVMSRDNRRKTCKQVRMFFSKSNPIAFTLKMGHKIKEIRKRLRDIDTDKNQFNLSERVIINMRDDGLRKARETGSYIPEDEVVGRNDDKKEIIDRLLKPNTKEDVAVISIVGMGGLGKTALAQSVYNDNMMVKHFELLLWVCVSDEFDVKVIIEKIVESANGNRPQSFLQIDLLQRELRRKIDGKKYLLVMDDVWNQNNEKWDNLKRLLMSGAKGSRILITTRSEQVAKTFDTSSLYYLKQLDEDNSWLLFKKIVFLKGHGEDPDNSSLVEIGKEIVAKLKGVPLAIRTIGRLLYVTKSKDFWLSFKDTELYNQVREQTGDLKYMLSILELSYNHLPYHLKQCFLYCAMFPKDFYIQKDVLILQWRVHGLIQPNEKDELIDIGEDSFMELLSRSFFQDVKKDKLGNIKACKMHDLMHDLACSIAKNECVHRVDNNIDKRTHHFSVDSIMSWEKLEALSKARNLRTFFVLNNYAYSLDGIFEKVFHDHLRLRALELRGFEDLSEKVLESISNLKHLRYLSIWNREIKFLPCSIAQLYNLETFILHGWSELRELPRDIKNLINLKHFCLTGNRYIEFLPNSIIELSNLETLILTRCTKLKKLPRDVKSWINLRHLDLSNSGIEFLLDSITHLNNLETLLLRGCDKLKELPEDTKNLINLKHLDMHECKSLTHMPKGLGQLTKLETMNLFVLGNDNNGAKLSELNGLNKLRGSLTIKGLQFCTTSNLQTNAKLLQLKSGLQKLVLEWKDSCSEPTINALDDDYERVLECLQPHSNLQKIYIKGYKGVKLCNWLSSPSYSFDCLVRMELSSCKRLQQLPRFDQFPNLKHLRLKDLPKIEHIIGSNEYPPSSTFFPSLEVLIILQMPNLKGWWKKSETSTKSAQNFPLSWKGFECLSYLQLYFTHEGEFLSSCLQHVTTLQQFSIHCCPNLTSLPESIGSLTSLSKLGIMNSPHLTSLPEFIGNLTSLSKLGIMNCPELASLPESIGNLTSLAELNISSCAKLSALPEGIRNLHNLESLTILGCPILKERCKRETGEDWLKIAHIRKVHV